MYMHLINNPACSWKKRYHNHDELFIPFFFWRNKKLRKIPCTFHVHLKIKKIKKKQTDEHGQTYTNARPRKQTRTQTHARTDICSVYDKFFLKWSLTWRRMKRGNARGNREYFQTRCRRGIRRLLMTLENRRHYLKRADTFTFSFF